MSGYAAALSLSIKNSESSQELVARGPQKRGALGHGLFGLCVNPSLTVTNNNTNHGNDVNVSAGIYRF